MRAEVGGSMVEVAVLEAQAVQNGALLGRIETRTLEDAKLSASSAVRSAENQLSVARREAERTEKLVSAGALAARDLDVVQNTDHHGRGATRRREGASGECGPRDWRHHHPSAVPGHRVQAHGQRRRRRESRHRALHHHRSLVHAARGVGAVRGPARSPRRGDRRVHRPRLRHARSREESSGSLRRRTRPLARCRSTWRFPTSADAWSQGSSPRGVW